MFCTSPEILGEKHAKPGRVGWWGLVDGLYWVGYIAVHVCQANAGSLPREVGSEIGMAC